MSVTLAIAATETFYRIHIAHISKDLRPAVLKPPGFMADPCTNRAYKPTQIVDMPMFGLRLTAMPRYACPYTAWAERAADVYIVSRLYAEPTPTANLNLRFGTTSQNQCVCSGFRFHVNLPVREG